jgi:diguanylate cyclase (GGDEF)-like protein/PAS domain S-box-containing protein
LIARLAKHSLLPSFAGLVGIIALLALSLVNEYREADKQAQSEVETLSRVLEAHTLAIVQQVDLILNDVQSHVRPEDMRLTHGAADPRSKKYHAMLKSHVANVLEVSLLHLINKNGEHIYSSLDTLPDVNLADRPYFQRHRDDTATGLMISAPIISRVTGNWTLILSRRINFEDGSFAGTVQASLDMKYFQQFYRSLNLNKHGMVALYDKHLSLAARFPPSETEMGKISNLEANFYIEKGMKHATYQANSPLDGVNRKYSFRQVGNLPLFVFAGVAEDGYLTEWRQHAWEYGIGLVIFSMVLIGLGQRQRRAEKALLKSEDLFRSALEHAPIGMALASPDGKFVRVNRAFCDIVGYEPEALLNLSFEAITHPDDVARDIACLKRMEAGEIRSYEIEKRFLHKDGRIVWVQNTVSISRDDKGKQQQIIQQVQDITERKELAQRLEHEARTDCLTGLSNRRHFLELATQELARVRRYRSPLTLAMLDVDHFKTINDTYGHEIGDKVLIELADICRRALREPDVVGRIGGEEFAILFPQTACDQAYEIAERLRMAIAAAEIPIEHGLPVHFTVSLGITSFAESDTNIDMLLSRADKALYEAKHNGRNRVVIEGATKEKSG